MQEQRHDNVVSLFGQKSSARTSAPIVNASCDELPSEEQLFADTMRKNAENQKRLQQDRDKANKSVLRSYRIKK